MRRRPIRLLAALAISVVGLGGTSAPASMASPPAHGCSQESPNQYNYMDNPDTLALDVTFHCSVPGPYRGDEFATMRGPFSALGPLSVVEASKFFVLSGDWLHLDPCRLPGGSDLPGAVLIYKTVISGPSPNQGLSAVDYWTLPSPTAGPVLTAGSTPPHGTRVHPGQVIQVHITANEANGDGPQSGIQEIAVGLSPYLTIDAATYGDHPTACDKSRLTRTLTTTYTVPDHPPPVITLIAYAHDFEGHQAKELSADFPTTGNTWTGTAHIVTQITRPPLCASTDVVDSTFNLVVGATGAVTGTRTWEGRATSCGPATTDGPYTFPQFGQVTAGQFHLTDLVVDLSDVTVVPISSSGKTASASVNGGPYHEGGSTSTWTGTISLTCKTC
ncbi:MAG TPA: hypothetical protein VEJ84_05730 [Acidimicrobiales bacterium]|nr:hypothetical protein [Acidimicrobiales bacterium]